MFNTYFFYGFAFNDYTFIDKEIQIMLMRNLLAVIFYIEILVYIFI